MQTLLIQTESEHSQKLLIELANKLGGKIKIIDNSIAEDLAFGTMMQEEKTGRKVSKKEILELLNK